MPRIYFVNNCMKPFHIVLGRQIQRHLHNTLSRDTAINHKIGDPEHRIYPVNMRFPLQPFAYPLFILVEHDRLAQFKRMVSVEAITHIVFLDVADDGRCSIVARFEGFRDSFKRRVKGRKMGVLSECAVSRGCLLGCVSDAWSC
jgi:hypothetical protein